MPDTTMNTGGHGANAVSRRVAMFTVVESSASADRFAAAADFVWSFPRGTEVLLLGATRAAVDDLAYRLTADVGASFGWQRFTLLQLASVLAQPTLAIQGLAHTSALGGSAIVARALYETRRKQKISTLEPVARFPGFTRALASTLTELRLAGVESAALAASEAPGPELATLLSEMETQLRNAAIADRAQLLEAALGAARVRQPPVGLPVLLFDIAIDSRRESDLLAALIDAAPAALMTLPSGDARTREFALALGGSIDTLQRDPEAPGNTPSSLTRLRRYLFDPGKPPELPEDETVKFFSAPGEQRECVEIARWMLHHADQGIRFDEMAVFLRAPQRYSLALEHALQRAKIPPYFARGTARPDPAGRAFVAVLRCKSEGLSARRFAEYLSFAQVPLPAQAANAREMWVAPQDEVFTAPIERSTVAVAAPPETEPDADKAPVLAGSLRTPWRREELLVEAAVIGGKQRWQRRLDGLLAQLRARLAELENEEPDANRMARARTEIERLGHLRSFALPIIDALDAFPQSAAWGVWLDALSALAPQVLRQPERVLAVLGELQPMAAAGPVTLEEVIDVLSDRLCELEQEPPAQRYGRVFIAPPEDARGRMFRVVFIPGLAERIFPQRPREDPLLTDALRAPLKAGLRTQASRAESERLQLHLAVGAATEHIYLSYPSVEIAEGRPRVPSFYGLDVIRAISGKVPDPEVFERNSAAASGARLAWPAPQDAQRAIDDIEHDLAVLGSLLHAPHEDPRGRARYLLELNGALGRSLRSRWWRWEKKDWGAADGLVRVTDAIKPLLAVHRLRTRPYSASALQRFAACPYQFYLAAILGLSPRSEPQRLERIDPLTKGRLIHTTQADLLRLLQRERLLPLNEERLAAAERKLDQTLDRVAERFHDDLAPAIDRVWKDEIENVRVDLRVWLQRLTAGGDTWQPAYFELGFGLPLRNDLDLKSVREPVRVAGEFVLRGAVDLVEKSPDGATWRVTDHKTGADRTPPGFVVAGGALLQPVLYSLAVEAALGVTVKEARLSFCTSAGGFADHVLPIDDLARRRAQQVLETIDRCVELGSFAPAPLHGSSNGRPQHACEWCDFREVCGPHEALRSRRKDPRLLQLLVDLRGLT